MKTIEVFLLITSAMGLTIQGLEGNYIFTIEKVTDDSQGGENVAIGGDPLSFEYSEEDEPTAELSPEEEPTID